MKLLGNRVLITRVKEENTDEFQAVKLQDGFVYKGKVELVSDEVSIVNVGDIIQFAKYSPDTQEIDYNGIDAKIIITNDILAIL